ncbi:putative holin-like toxin [Pediococcus acidilactici]|nr:putative holin-like toxin [Pediococcus acidilactici]KAF0348011.1 putative holin-like toxin [Pediococcus acidilactici]KAF0392426.1 putative holin-like toxin [Pediococcus acidilactici]KAF0395875.1 putative holin-like toxin [Pediococcus acidilactici]KAF0458299.1 putative holin-like toxin [Pediococcus acidilactici]
MFRKVSQSTSVFQTLSLMLLFAMFILALLTYIDKRNK